MTSYNSLKRILSGGLFFIFFPLLLGRVTNNTGAFYLGIVLFLFAAFHLCRQLRFTDAIGDFLQLLKKRFYLIFLFFSGIWITIMVITYLGADFRTWDIGYFSNIVARFAATGNVYSTIIEMNPLGDHFSPNLLLLFPFFKLHPSVLWLAVFQIAAYLATVLVLLKIGRQVFGKHHALAYAVPFLFLVHYYVTKTVLFHTQPTAFSLPFISLAFLFAFDRNYFKMAVVLVFLLGFKEHMALIWVSMGFFLIIRNREFKIGGTLIILGLLLGLATQFLIMPLFNEGSLSPHYGKFDPFALVPSKLALISLALVSVGFLPLTVPRSLLMILPAFGIALVSNADAMVTFDFHYQDIALVVLFTSVLYALEQIRLKKSWVSKLQPVRFQILIAAILLITIWSIPKLPTAALWKRWPKHRESLLFEEIQDYRQHAPDNRNIWVDERMGPFFIDHPAYRSIDYWLGGWKKVQEEQEPHLILLAGNDLTALPDEIYAEFEQILDAGNYKADKRYRTFTIYRLD